MHGSTTLYVKSLSKRAEGTDREKTLPGGYFGSTMVAHGEDFEADSEFGNCLSGERCRLLWKRCHFTDRAQPSVARMRDSHVYRRPMSRAQLQPGWKASSAPWLR
jgi:hypothetical protein